jgi:hypothetical protein
VAGTAGLSQTVADMDNSGPGCGSQSFAPPSATNIIIICVCYFLGESIMQVQKISTICWLRPGRIDTVGRQRLRPTGQSSRFSTDFECGHPNSTLSNSALTLSTRGVKIDPRMVLQVLSVPHRLQCVRLMQHGDSEARCALIERLTRESLRV